MIEDKTGDKEILYYFISKGSSLSKKENHVNITTWQDIIQEPPLYQTPVPKDGTSGHKLAYAHTPKSALYVPEPHSTLLRKFKAKRYFPCQFAICVVLVISFQALLKLALINLLFGNIH